MAKTKRVGGKVAKKNIPSGIVHIQATFNNTIVTVTDLSGNTICWASAGSSGFKGSRKSTPYAAQLAAEEVSKTAKDHGVKQLSVFVKGPGSGREAALRTILASGFKINIIKDVTPVMHNGCRPPKRRRV